MSHKKVPSEIRILIASMLVVLITPLLCACGGSGAASLKPVSKEGYYLDTICSISIYRMTDEKGEVRPASEISEAAEAAEDKAFELCKELEDKLSRTRTDSDISRVNLAKGEWTGVSDDAIEIVQKGKGYSELSGGDFDISIGGVTKQWDFHAAEGEAKLPDADALAEAVKHVNYKNIEIDGNKLRLSDPQAEIDLGGIAKGYIGDRMTEVLEKAGVVSATINLGGNVICIGGKTDEDDFVIGVEAPFSDRSEIIGKVKSRDKTLVTSGVYERRIEVNGKMYHHILDTKTGWPAETDLDAVTLVTEKGRSADIDALSTTCLIKGSDEGIKLIESLDGIEGVFLLSDGSIKQTSGMEFEPVS